MSRDSTPSALERVQGACATSSRDAGATEPDAILWGLLLGWDTSEEDLQDEGAVASAYPDLAERFGWDEDFIARLRHAHEVMTRTAVRIPQIGDLALHATGRRRELGLDDSDPFVVVGVRRLRSGEVQVKVRIRTVTPWTPVDAFTYAHPTIP